MSKYDDLEKLEDLRQKGAITEEEYQREKSAILNSGDNASGSPKGDTMLGLSENNYLMLMHLSQFAGFIIFGLGFALPIIMWQMNKNNPEIDRHGKNIANFMISMIIYGAVAFLLVFILVGIPILIVLGILEIVFVIMATVKANRGEYWKYPLSIQFFS